MRRLNGKNINNMDFLGIGGPITRKLCSCIFKVDAERLLSEEDTAKRVDW